MRRVQAGFTIIELLVVVAVIAIVASVAIPRMLGAKLSANETSAIAVMRAIVAAQMQAQTANSIDSDADGLAEFAYLGELAGTVPARKSIGGVPGPGVVGVDELAPSALIAALGRISNGMASRAGYHFRLFLSDNAGAGVPEDPNGGKTVAPFPDPNFGETTWCAYGWPIEASTTGNKCYFVNQEGMILETANRGAGAYTGSVGGPAFDAVFTVAADMTSPISTGPGAPPAVDGRSWVIVQ
jgi:prepilin-type N-terminal cleavage/methylation domain-containing protein